MAEVDSWRDELSSLLEGTGVRYAGDPMESSSTTSFQVRRSEYVPSESLTVESERSGESFKDQAMGFVMAWCEILTELARGCRDIVQQNLMNENSYVVKKLGGPCAKASKRLRFLNDFLPEDRDPVQAWSVVLFVFVLALAGSLINSLSLHLLSTILSTNFIIVSFLSALNTVSYELLLFLETLI